MTNISQNGPGGCMCKKMVQKGKQNSGPTQVHLLQPPASFVPKTRVLHTDSNILILGLLSKTHNIKNVGH